MDCYVSIWRTFRTLLHWIVTLLSNKRLGFSFIGLFTCSSHADRSLETIIVWFCSAFSSPTKAEHCILLFHLNRHSSNGQRYNSSNFTSEHRLTACNCFNEIEAGENLKSQIYNKWLTSVLKNQDAFCTNFNSKITNMFLIVHETRHQYT